MSELVTLQVADEVATLTLNRPEVHNALDDELMRRLTQALRTAGADPKVRAIVLTGAGKSFCAGADIRWMQRMVAYTFEENLADAHVLSELLHTLRLLPQPVIARVHGAAIGGGLGLVAAADIAGAVAGAKFSLSEVRLGILPAVISPFVLERIGMTAARRYALTAELFDGAEAHRIGLVAECFDTTADLDVWIAGVTTQIRRSGPAAVAACKRELMSVARTPWDELCEQTTRTIAEVRVTPEAQEGLRAFLEKRDPAWVCPPGGR